MASRLLQLFRTLELLARPGGTTIEELKEHLGIDRKSVYRWLENLEDYDEGLGIPVLELDKSPGEREKRLGLDKDHVKKFPNFTTPNIDLTLPEIISIYLLRAEAKIYRGTDIQKRIDSAVKKISHRKRLPNDTFTTNGNVA